MEGDVVIFALLRQRLDLRNVLRRNIGHELDDDRTILQLDRQHMIGRLGKGVAREGGEVKHAGKCEIEEFHVSSVAAENALRICAWIEGPSRTAAGTKALTSPPMAAIWRTNVAVIGREAVPAGRKMVWMSGAI